MVKLYGTLKRKANMCAAPPVGVHSIVSTADVSLAPTPGLLTDRLAVTS